MDGYAYPYSAPYPQMRHPDATYPDHGDGFGDYYGVGHSPEPSKRSIPAGWPTSNYYQQCGEPCDSTYPYEYWQWMQPYMYAPSPRYKADKRPSCSKHHNRKSSRRSRSHESDTKSRSRSRSKSRSQSRSKSRSRSHSKSRSESGSRSSISPHHKLTYKEPTLLDAFRVMYLTPSKHKKVTTKFLATKKKQDRIQELLESDGLGSKRWLFYPRVRTHEEVKVAEVPSTRETCDRRIKVDGDFFRKYKKSMKVDNDAPITKLKRWELVLYKKLGFVQAV